MVAVNKVLEAKKSKKLNQGYDVILLDLDMPILDGYGACRQIKEEENGKGQGIHALL
jgi:CheY-like chemotaxis protein